MNTVNSGARKRILERIRKGLERQELTREQVHGLEQRDVSTKPFTQPRRNESLLDQFCSNLVSSGGSFDTVDNDEAIIKAIENLKARHCPDGNLVSAPALAHLPWPDNLQVEFGSTHEETAMGVSQSICGIAETGSVLLVSGQSTPTLLNFLPDVHVVVVHRNQIFPHLEDAWKRLRDLGEIPRTVNLITGPSKTADVEQTLQIGAHGPCQFHVLIVCPQSQHQTPKSAPAREWPA
jgi:L-lactate utilization protein LutC